MVLSSLRILVAAAPPGFPREWVCLLYRPLGPYHKSKIPLIRALVHTRCPGGAPMADLSFSKAARDRVAQGSKVVDCLLLQTGRHRGRSIP